MKHIDQIILSCNEDPTYRDFWPIISWAYKKIFPDVTVHLAFVTHREETDQLVEFFRKSGRVTLFRPVGHVPEASQAKVARLILASMQGGDVCYIDDIDLFPLSKAFITDKTNQRPEGSLLCVGGEVYDNNGCYPMSQHTAEGFVWKAFMNPEGLEYKELIEKYALMSWKFDRREDLCIHQNMAADDYFSDERLIRKLVYLNPIPKFELSRGYDNYLDATIDRHTWNKEKGVWEFDRDKLKNHGYVNAHGIRPFKKYEWHYEPLIQYIEQNYGK